MTMQHSPLVHAARRSGVRDTRVLRAVAEIPRASFVPDGVREEAMVDMPLPSAYSMQMTGPKRSPPTGIGAPGGANAASVIAFVLVLNVLAKAFAGRKRRRLGGG